MESASGQQLAQLQTAIGDGVAEYGLGLGKIPWGYRGGYSNLETWAFPMAEGVLIVGVRRQNNDAGLALWTSLHDDLPKNGLSLTFKMTIPDEADRRCATVYARRGNLIEVLHTGKFTVRRGIRRAIFFNYYRKNPGVWPILEEKGRKYLVFHTFDPERMWYQPFYSFLSNLSSFLDYLSWFRDEVRAELDNQAP